MLYRHWNLYDSMYYSRYIATNLGIWKQNGRKKLDTLLAKMGLPLDECRLVNYCFTAVLVLILRLGNSMLP